MGKAKGIPNWQMGRAGYGASMPRAWPWSFAGLLALIVPVACGGRGGGGGGGGPAAPVGWQRSSANPLLTPAIAPSPSTTYELSIADPSVRYDGDLQLWQAWFSTTVFDTAIANDPGRIAIKYATSPDGIAWNVQAAPVLSSRGDPADWDYTHVETPSVVRNPDPAAPASQRYLMFYAGGNRDADTLAGRPQLSIYPYYQIGLAYSADGTAFTRVLPGIDGKPGLVLTAEASLAGSVAGYGDGLIADPEVLVRGGHLELWCSSFAESVNGSARSPLAFGISHARSADGVTWTMPAPNPLDSLYKPGELAGGEQPAVLFDAVRGRYEMWFKNDSDAERALLPTLFFTAYGFWHAVSSDGLTWTPDYGERDFAWRSDLDYEQYGLLTGCSVVRRGDVDSLYYASWGVRGIPDPARYLVPLQAGGTVPAVITFGLAARQLP